MNSSQLMQFTNLKMKICKAAADALDAINPQYVQTFRKRMEETEDDLDRVIDETRPLLGEGLEDWRDLLTSVLDLELVIDKVRRSLTFLKSDIAGTPEDTGAWVIYHDDHWLFQMHALHERLDNLVCLVFRRLVRLKDDGWQVKEKAIRNDVKKLKGEIAKLRNPLAHGLGGGVTGIQENQLWEPFLAVRLFDVDLVSSAYQDAASMKKRWHSLNRRTTMMAFQAVEAVTRELSGHIP